MKFYHLVLLGMLLAGFAQAAVTGAPWSKSPFKKVEADRGGEYPLTQDNGPWMIMAATFSGDGAEQQAKDLVVELRGKHKLPAYLYKKEFDFSKTIQGRGIDRYGGPQAMRYQRDDRVEEIAVLVGDYPEVTDPNGQKTLKRLKYLRTATLNSSEETYQSMAAIRMLQKAVLPESSAEKKKGPMGSAFLTTNPLLPQDYYVPKGIDKFVVEMNKGVKYSLLDCPGRYTVKVATFTGQVVLGQKDIEKVERAGKAMKRSRLMEGAEKAHELVEKLRAKGAQAFVFHDRYMSIVTVGSFNTVGTRGEDGRIELNPAVHAVMKQYGAEAKVVPGQTTPQIGQPKTEGRVAFDVSPVPVEVPERSIAADYTRTANRR